MLHRQSKSVSVTATSPAYQTYRPLSRLPTPPLSWKDADESPLASPQESLNPKYFGPAIHLTNLIPTASSVAQPSALHVQAILTRARLPLETIALAVCVLDSLNDRFPLIWRTECPSSSGKMDDVSLRWPHSVRPLSSSSSVPSSSPLYAASVTSSTASSTLSESSSFDVIMQDPDHPSSSPVATPITPPTEPSSPLPYSSSTTHRNTLPRILPAHNQRPVLPSLPPRLQGHRGSSHATSMSCSEVSTPVSLFSRESVDPVVIALAALSIACKFLHDESFSHRYICTKWAQDVWTCAQLSATERCILEAIGHRIMPLCDEDLLCEAMVDMQLAATPMMDAGDNEDS